jgi:tetratricopeptide (TPR) repeat protein
MNKSPRHGRAARCAWHLKLAAAGAIAATVLAAAPIFARLAPGAAAPAAPSRATLQAVPPIDTSAMEPAVRRQVEEAQRRVAGAAALPAAEAATSFGEAGKTFLAYLLQDAAMPCFENAVALAPRDYRWAFFAGVTALSRGDLDRARAHSRRALALQSPFPAGLVHLGDVEILSLDFEAAGRAYTAALAFPDTAAAAHFGLGKIALQRGDARLAAEHFEATLAAQPAASIVHSQLAIAYRRLGQLDKAAAQAAAHGDSAVRFADPLISEMEAANVGNGHRIMASFQALREGRAAAAVEGFRQAAAVDPHDVSIWLGLGHAQEVLGDAAGAEQSFRRAVEVEPQNSRARLKLGTVLAQRGSRTEAIEQLRTAVRLRPDLKDAHFNLATALAQEGRLAEAAAECDALLRLAPEDRDARALRDQLAEDLGKQQPGKDISPPPP